MLDSQLKVHERGRSRQIGVFQVYPNTATNVLLVASDLAAESPTYHLLDMLGRPVRVWATNKPTTPDVSELPSGFYHLPALSPMGALLYCGMVELVN